MESYIVPKEMRKKEVSDNAKRAILRCSANKRMKMTTGISDLEISQMD